MAALAQLSDDDLKRVILGRPLVDGASPYYQPRGDISYPDDVKIEAINKLHETGLTSTLIALADDDRAGGGKMEMVKGETPITKAIKAKFMTPDGLDKLCAACEKGNQAAYRMLLGMWEQETGDDFFLWIAQHEKRKALIDTFERDWNDSVGQKATARIKGTDALTTVARNGACSIGTRVAAAVKSFGNNDVTGDGIRATVVSFEGCEDSVIAEVADAGIKNAKRIGATNIAQELEAKYSASMKKKENAARKRAASIAFVNNLGELHDFFVEGRDHNAKAGDVFCNMSAAGMGYCMAVFGLSIEDMPIRWRTGTRDWEKFNCAAVVKQAVNGGVVVGCAKEIQSVRTGTEVNIRVDRPNINTPVYTTYKFTSRIFVKTDRRFADGDKFDVAFLKYLGTTTHKSVNGSNVTFHTFEPYQIPDDMK